MLTAAAMLFGGNWAVARYTQADLPPMALSFLRWMVAAAALAPFAAFGLWRNRAVVRANWRRLILLGLLGVAGFTAPAYTGLQFTTAVNGALLNSASPILVIIFGLFGFGDRNGWRQVAGVIVSLIGVLAIVTRGAPEVLLTLQFNPGDLWVLLAVLLWSIYTVLLRLWPVALPPAESLLISILFALPLLGGLFAWELSTGRSMAWTWPAVGAVLYIGLGSSVFSYLFWVAAVPKVGAARASLFQYLIPVFAAIFAYLLVDERVRWFHLAGAALIVGGIIFANRKPRGG